MTRRAGHVGHALATGLLQEDSGGRAVAGRCGKYAGVAAVIAGLDDRRGRAFLAPRRCRVARPQPAGRRARVRSAGNQGRRPPSHPHGYPISHHYCFSGLYHISAPARVRGGARHAPRAANGSVCPSYPRALVESRHTRIALTIHAQTHPRQRNPATALLKAHGIAFTEHPYEYLEHGGAQHSAEVLCLDPFAVVKTLVMQDEKGAPLIVLMHGNRTVSTKNLARQIGAKSIEPCTPEVENRHSGYLVGGTSPFATRKKMPVSSSAPSSSCRRSGSMADGGDTSSRSMPTSACACWVPGQWIAHSRPDEPRLRSPQSKRAESIGSTPIVRYRGLAQSRVSNMRSAQEI
jgi:Cys-tRNA(Pro) deacylase